MDDKTIHTQKCNQSAFTLIELSIVLVVIGLIVGGVLVGNDLISAARARSAITQLQQLASAVNVFRSRYDCIPGDCGNATSFLPASYSATVVSNNGCTGNGNDNGLLDVWPCESQQAYQSLRSIDLLKFLPESYGNIQTVNTNGIYFPGYNNSVTYFYYKDLYAGTGATRFGTAVTWANYCLGTWVDAYALSPDQTRAIDMKIDDGLPISGRFIGADASTPSTAGGTILIGSCAISGANSYVQSAQMGCRTIYYLQ